MARELQRLSARAVLSKRRAGLHADGGGLYLQVSTTGAKSWIFRYMLNRRSRDMGLGSLNAISLSDARIRAAEARRLLAHGIDPIAARDARSAEQRLEAARSIMFKECADAYIKAHRASWKNAKHAEQWENTLATYCGPVFSALPVQAVDTALVVKVLEPIWTAKHETATRLRARIERVLDWANVRGFRSGENPARWRGHLDKLLPHIEKRKRVTHHAALPFAEIGAFMQGLRAEEGIAARALEFAILTAGRTGEVIGARWEEIDFQTAMWTIPAARMKAHREHRVPLSPSALTLLQRLYDVRGSDFVFPGRRGDKPLTNMAMLRLLERMGRDDLTVHGFRSTFRDWAAERTSYPREVAEMALAHTISDRVEAAYRRGDLFEKRRRLMNEWEKFCDTPALAGKVVPIRKGV